MSTKTRDGETKAPDGVDYTRRALLRAGWSIPIILAIAPPVLAQDAGSVPDPFPSSGRRRGRNDGEDGSFGAFGGGGGSPGGGLGGLSGYGGYNGEEELFDLE